jgi:hypothetical protein
VRRLADLERAAEAYDDKHPRVFNRYDVRVPELIVSPL